MKRELIIFAFIVAAGFAVLAPLSNYLEHNRVRLPEQYVDSDLDLQGKKLKGYSLGADGMLADWYWMRSLQYIGDKIVRHGLDKLNIEDLTPLNPRLLYPMLDNATTLDPKLIAAYSYGATILPAIDSEQAIALTEKGIANNPDQWRLYQYLGYIHWRLKNYEKAAEVYEKGATIPGSPPFFRMMAAKMKSDSGSRDTARQMYKQMVAESNDQQTKAVAELRVQQLDSWDEIDAVNAVLREQNVKAGKCPENIKSIFPYLRTVRLPEDRQFQVDRDGRLADPSGVPYVLDTGKCEIHLDYEITKIPNS